MPLRNSVSKLEDLSINQIENILRNICLKSANYVSENFYDEKISRGHVVSSCLERVVHETQEKIALNTMHCKSLDWSFHISHFTTICPIIENPTFLLLLKIKGSSRGIFILDHILCPM